MGKWILLVVILVLCLGCFWMTPYKDGMNNLITTANP